jgi:hypothetical protein
MTQNVAVIAGTLVNQERTGAVTETAIVFS